MQRESGGIWELRKIFSQPSFEEIFDGHFERDADEFGVHLKPTLWISCDASLVRPV